MGWSYELLHSGPGITPGELAVVTPVVNLMRTETLLGQCLDLKTAGMPDADTGAALRTVRYKTSAYTIERPLQLGALLAGADPDQLQAGRVRDNLTRPGEAS